MSNEQDEKKKKESFMAKFIKRVGGGYLFLVLLITLLIPYCSNNSILCQYYKYASFMDRLWLALKFPLWLR
jgi:hypothetical protein